MKPLSPLPPPDSPETQDTPALVTDPRKEFLTNNTLTETQLAAFHRLWDLINSQTDGSSLEEIHEESAAA